MKLSTDSSSSSPVFHAENIPAELCSIPHVVLRLDYQCGCKTFYPLSLSDYCAEPALTALALVGVYPSKESAHRAAKALSEAAQREMQP